MNSVKVIYIILAIALFLVAAYKINIYQSIQHQNVAIALLVISIGLFIVSLITTDTVSLIAVLIVFISAIAAIYLTRVDTSQYRVVTPELQASINNANTQANVANIAGYILAFLVLVVGIGGALKKDMLTF